MKKQPLTLKQQRFVAEYLVDLNATQAAIRAGYSKRSANNIGPGNLLKPIVQVEIQKQCAKLLKRIGIDQDWVLDKYKKLACYNITDFFNDDGTIKKLSEIPEDAMFAIQGLEVDTKTIGDDVNSFIQKFKLPDKKGTIDSIAKLLGLMVDKVKHEGEIKLTHELSDNLKGKLDDVYKGVK